MMIEPRSTATIKALASLAELSANQLEEGVSVDHVIATLRKAAEAVRLVVDVEAEEELDDFEFEADSDTDVEAELEASEADIVQDLTPMDLSEDEADRKIVALDKKDAEAASEEDDIILNAG
ncbi:MULTISPECIES: hypothetical protein [Stappiaceae]|nr:MULTISPECIES: hypothetical protein [Stappiaceae]MEC9401787.1 hypothetical protein [Pseudomonadota bacterium]MBN8183634.1 hypothetical protein [Roseibium aggregatum]MBO6855272.1 hypothetical protein [Roseibium sp.]NKX64123.1 hypothetical protein [Labrenzia sp. 5N]UES38079.1 hypothetical protein GFC08_09540 [Roseibium aggregatum]